MRLVRPRYYLCCLATLATLTAAPLFSTAPGTAMSWSGGFAVNAQENGKLVYADFENVKDKRAFSNRGGYVQIISNSERKTLESRYKGLAGSNPPAPELVRLRPDDPNRAIAFDYELQALNAWAFVGVEVHGQEDKEGKPVADDLSAYRYLTTQIYVTGREWIRFELISRGQGLAMQASPKMDVKLKPGFNTYRFPLDKLAQPDWVEQKVNVRDVLKKVTAVTLSVYCDQCLTTKGTVVVDNMTFEK